MTDITVDKVRVKSILWERMQKMDPKIKPNVFVDKMILDTMLTSPALIIPSKDIVYVHGNIPEEYIELVLTHEFLHGAIQRVLGYNKDKKPKTMPIDKVVDNPIFNGVLCRAMEIEPMGFYEWLTKNAFDNRFFKLALKIAWNSTRQFYEYMTKLSDVLWYGKSALQSKDRGTSPT